MFGLFLDFVISLWWCYVLGSRQSNYTSLTLVYEILIFRLIFNMFNA